MSVALALALAGCGGGGDQPSRRQAVVAEMAAIGGMVLSDEAAELCENLTDSAQWKLTLLFAGSKADDRCPEAMHRFVTMVSRSRPELRRELGDLGPEDIAIEGKLATVHLPDKSKTLLEEVDGRWRLTLPPEQTKVTPIR